MQLSEQQRLAFKAHILANTNQITVGSDAPIAINASPGIAGDPTYRDAIRDWYNLQIDYRVHRSSITRVEVYKTTVPAADSSTGAETIWNWTGFKQQGVPEQNAWFEMFMGGGCDFGNLNNRIGAKDIFGTAGVSGENRIHIFNVARRRCTNFERLYVTAVPGNVPVNTGNVTANQRGLLTNPDNLGIGADLLPISGPVTTAMVSAALDG